MMTLVRCKGNMILTHCYSDACKNKAQARHTREVGPKHIENGRLVQNVKTTCLRCGRVQESQMDYSALASSFSVK